MTTATRNPAVVKSIVPESKTRRLGRILSRDYVAIGNDEYAVERGRSVAIEDYTPHPDELLISYETIELADPDDPRSGMRHVSYRKAYKVPSGTYERSVSGRRGSTPTEPRPLDALAEYGRAGGGILPIPTAGKLESGVAAAALDKELPRPWIELPNGLPDTQPGTLVAYLESRGITVKLGKGGRIIASSTKRYIHANDRRLLELAEPLIAHELGGPSVICVLCDAHAIGIAVPRAPVCEEHSA